MQMRIIGVMNINTVPCRSACIEVVIIISTKATPYERASSSRASIKELSSQIHIYIPFLNASGRYI